MSGRLYHTQQVRASVYIAMKKVLISGGSVYPQGAEVLIAIASALQKNHEITAFLPRDHITEVKEAVPEAQLYEFVQAGFSLKDIGLLVQECKKSDMLLMLPTSPEEVQVNADTPRAIYQILKRTDIPAFIFAEESDLAVMENIARGDITLWCNDSEFQRIFSYVATDKSLLEQQNKYGIPIIRYNTYMDVLASIQE